MKQLFTVTFRTKAEYDSGVAPAAVPPKAFPTLIAAKASAETILSAGTVSHAEIYGPVGLMARFSNPEGA
jgi:hypothetical protein